MSDKISTRIYLIGFMGSGKSHIGQLLSSAMGLHYIDLDKEIEKKDMSISEIFEKKGEDYFRKLEREALLKTSALEKTIIACGGGTPCFFDNMEWLNRNGITVFLNPAIEILIERLINEREKRPLLLKKSDNEIHNYIIELLKTRMQFYQKADFEIQEADEIKIITRIKEIIS
jgi:shikimate kinase